MDCLYASDFTGCFTPIPEHKQFEHCCLAAGLYQRASGWLRVARAHRLMLLLTLALAFVFFGRMLKSELCACEPREYVIHRNETKAKPIPWCDPMPPDLRPVQVDTTQRAVDLTGKFPEVKWGGWYSPPHCVARHAVAIIVPYRNSPKQLAIFLNHMHPFLMKQQIEYGIFIIEQKGMHDFNRGKLLNVGFAESQKLKASGWQCFIFHDIDLLPLDHRNLYSCPNPRHPRHMAVAIDKNDFSLLYATHFGGVTALTLEQFNKVNGFSNRYGSGGGEDDDLYNRLTHTNYTIARYDAAIAQYASLGHALGSPDPIRDLVLSQAISTFKRDGLSNLEYLMSSTVQRRLFTHITADIDLPMFLGD